MFKNCLMIALCFGCTTSPSLIRAEEWIQFGGSDYGRTSVTNVAKRWISEIVAWKTPLSGRGASSPVIFNNHVYLTAYTGYGIDIESPGNPADLVRHLLCIEIEDGNIVWQKSVPAQSDKNEFTTWGVAMHGYASSTPAVDETGVYVFFGETGVLAFDHAGNELWRTNCGAGTHAFGAGNSPVLYRNLVMANASVESGDMIALNKSDGSEVWPLRSNPMIVLQKPTEVLTTFDLPMGSPDFPAWFDDLVAQSLMVSFSVKMAEVSVDGSSQRRLAGAGAGKPRPVR